MDLSTTYMGLPLKNPLMPSSSPLSADLNFIKRMEDAGAAGIVLHSLFEEQLSHEAAEIHHLTQQGTESFAESLTYFPEPEEYRLGPDQYLEHIRKAKEAVDIPIIGSLNGITVGGWTDIAQQMEQAGADALELNVYIVPANTSLSGRVVESLYEDILKAVKNTVKIPVAMKLSPFFSGTASMATRLDEAGADALVLFNRFYQPDIDINELEVAPNLVLSDEWELRLPLRWIAILYGHLEASLAITSGVSKAEHVIKAMMAGADVAQMCSVLLRKGVGEIATILRDVQTWMEEHEYDSIDLMRAR